MSLETQGLLSLQLTKRDSKAHRSHGVQKARHKDTQEPNIKVPSDCFVARDGHTVPSPRVWVERFLCM